jgi:TolB protein
MRKLLSCLFAILLTAATAHSQSDILPPVVRNITGEVRPVCIESPDASVHNLLSRAFTLHGAYSLTSAEKADFVFLVTPVDANSVNLEILSGVPAQSLFKSAVRGKNQSDAALRAADLAVSKTSGLKGIFAGRIAFVGQRGGATELYEGGLLFGEMRQLTSDNARCVRPSFSPDGGRLLYTSYYRNGFPDIYSIELGSGKRDVFLSFNGKYGCLLQPRRQPRGHDPFGHRQCRAYTISSSGKDMVRLTKNKSIESDPSWSPDGKNTSL